MILWDKWIDILCRARSRSRSQRVRKFSFKKACFFCCDIKINSIFAIIQVNFLCVWAKKSFFLLLHTLLLYTFLRLLNLILQSVQKSIYFLLEVFNSLWTSFSCFQVLGFSPVKANKSIHNSKEILLPIYFFVLFHNIFNNMHVGILFGPAF